MARSRERDVATIVGALIIGDHPLHQIDQVGRHIGDALPLHFVIEVPGRSHQWLGVDFLVEMMNALQIDSGFVA